ncbi:MAG: member of Set1p complex, histone methyl transferase [Claussenomyces sp. TS43310]|nr:MAG: member of Set1p complex, histone methyl transferase [Claussenomyces sp. TS43310]
MSTPMQVDSPLPASGLNGLGKINGLAPMARIQDMISTYRGTKLFRRDHHSGPISILSLDFDDQGDLLMTSESDETIQIYNVKEGKHSKQCLSKKYGAKHAKFSHTASCIIYASTKENDTLRYLSTHDNSFIRYFKGHEKPVTCIATNPGADTFLSCSEDNTVRLWDTNTDNCCGKLLLAQPYLAAFDPSASVIAIASEAAQSVVLYDFRNFDKEPFATFDVLQHAPELRSMSTTKCWNKLEFSNDGKSLLVGTSGHGHFVLDAFDGSLRSYLSRQNGGPKRLAAGEHNTEGIDPSEARKVSSGDACFTPDGRYVISGQRRENVLVWDTLQSTATKKMMPVHELEFKGEAAVIAFNPRYNMFASADKELVFWIPDPNANI